MPQPSTEAGKASEKSVSSCTPGSKPLPSTARISQDRSCGDKQTPNTAGNNVQLVSNDPSLAEAANEAARSKNERFAESQAHLFEDTAPDGGWQAWAVVLGTHLVIMDTWGIVNSFGVFQPYYTEALSRTPSDVSWIGSFEVFLLFFIGTFTGRLTDAGYFKPLFYCGCVLVVISMFATSFCTSYWQLFLAQGICMGLGNGLLFTPCMAVTSTYFLRKKALAIGIVSAGAVTGGLMFPSMVRQLLPRIGFPWTIRAMAFVQLGTLVMSALLMKTRIAPRKAGGLVEWGAFRDLAYTFYVIAAFMCFWGIYFSFHYVASFAHEILEMQYSHSLDLLLVLNGVGAIGRVLPNYIADHVGTINVYIPLALFSAVSMYCWIAVESRVGLYVWTSFYGVAGGGLQGLFLAVVGSITKDPQRQGTRMGMATTIVSFASLTGTPITGAIIDAQNHSYVGAQVFSGTCLLLGMVFAMAARVVLTRRMNAGILSMVKV
ncbi:MFS-type transporter dbaD [Paramyrothecium foliicola]|nr:MFS-type transporter dbaD [Paramyrothecium foliicola]